MKLYQKLMRWLAPACEKQRAEFRYEMARAHAEVEDFHRTVTLNRDDIAKAIEAQMIRKGPLP